MGIPLRLFASVLLLILVHLPGASAQQAELQAVISADEELSKKTAELDQAIAEVRREVARTGSQTHTDVSVARLQQVVAQEAQIAARQKRSTAVEKYQTTVIPISDLVRFAVETRSGIGAIQAQNNQSVGRSKAAAIATIDRDLRLLLNAYVTKQSPVFRDFERYLRRVNINSDVEDLSQIILEGDPAAQELVKLVWDKSGAEILKLQGPARLNAWHSALGKIGIAMKIRRTFIDDPNAGALDSVEFERLISMVDLVGDTPGGDQIGLKVFALYATQLMATMRDGIRAINLGTSRRNLVLLFEAANAGTIECAQPDSFDTSPSSLFGTVDRMPRIDIDNPMVIAGDTITGKWCSSQEFDDSAWLGIVRNNLLPQVPANRRLLEVVNDLYDTEFINVGESAAGTFSFKTGRDWVQGDHFVRMFSDDNGGYLAANETISIKSCGTGKYFRTQRATYKVGEDIEVEYCGLSGAKDDFISIAKMGVDDSDYQEWYWARESEGVMTFSDEIPPGDYEARYNPDYDTVGYNVVERASFSVASEADIATAANWLDGAWTVKSGPYSGLKVYFTQKGGVYSGMIIVLGEDATAQGLTLGQDLFRNIVIQDYDQAGGECYRSEEYMEWNIYKLTENTPATIRVYCPNRLDMTWGGD